MKERIRNLILSLGADVCGFARIDRFADAPVGYKPTDIFPDCRSVISFGSAWITVPSAPLRTVLSIKNFAGIIRMEKRSGVSIPWIVTDAGRYALCFMEITK
jgi:hypothetical protein